MNRSLPLVAIVVAVFAMIVLAPTPVARADDAGASIIAQSDAALRSLSTYQLREVITIEASGRQFQQTTDASYILPDRSYVRASLGGQTNEVVRQGDAVYLRQGGGDWQTTSLSDLGIDPGQVAGGPIPTSQIAGDIQLADESDDLYHLTVPIDGDRMLSVLQSVLGSGAAGGALSGAQVSVFSMDYYVRKADMLPDHGSLYIQMTVAGIDETVRGDFTYSNFNGPVPYPGDLPQ